MKLDPIEKQLLTQPIIQACIALLGFIVVHPDGQRLAAAHHDHQVFAAGHSRVNQISLQ